MAVLALMLRLVSLARSLARLTVVDKVVVAQLLAWLAVVEVAVRLVPLPMLAARLGVPVLALAGPDAALLPGGEGSSLPMDGNWVVLGPLERRRAQLLVALVRRWPWGGGPCLRQSLVLGHVLRRHHPVLRLGVARRGEDVMGHAWVEIGGHSLDPGHDFLPFQRAPAGER